MGEYSVLEHFHWTLTYITGWGWKKGLELDIVTSKYRKEGKKLSGANVFSYIKDQEFDFVCIKL